MLSKSNNINGIGYTWIRVNYGLVESSMWSSWKSNEIFGVRRAFEP